MHKPSIYTTYFSVLAIFLVLFTACGAPAQTGTGAGDTEGSQEPIKIGVIFPLSGALARVGQDSLEGAEIARDIVNSQGGVNGRQVEFIVADVPDATAAVNETNRLISQEKVSVIFGVYSSSLSLAASEVTERNQVIFWEEAAVAAEITGRGYKYVFRTNANSEHYGQTAVNYAVDTLAPTFGIAKEQLKVAIVHEDSNYGQAVGGAAEQQARELGLQVVAKEAYNNKSVDLSSMILRVKDAAPDVIVATSYVNDAILFWKQARERGLNIKALIGTGAGYSSPEFPEARGSDTDGVFNVSNPFGINKDALNEEAKQLDAEFVKRYKEKYSKEPSLQVYLSFTGAWTLLHHTLPNASSITGDAIRQAALDLELPEGSTVLGWGANFDETGQNTAAFPVVMQWQEGEIVTIAPERLAKGSLKFIPYPRWDER